MLQKARAFFVERDVVEVDTSLLQKRACVDVHIDLLQCQMGADTYYLHSSPEYAMKKLLAEGVGDCFQLGHVFRKDEHGSLHRPEFTMAEWYRIDFSLDQMIKETLTFLQTVIRERVVVQKTYREAFLETIGIDPLQGEDAALAKALPDECRESELVAEGRDGVLNLLLGLRVEPALAERYGDSLVVIKEYPASQSALARVAIDRDGNHVAQRFEVYCEGMELANGYHELTDSKEQFGRLREANRKRVALGKEELPIDDDFIGALERGLPDCCGVAVGFDRLMMLRHNASDIGVVV